MTDVITVGVTQLHNDYARLRPIAQNGGIVYIRNGWTGEVETALVSVTAAEAIERDTPLKQGRPH